MANTDIKWFSFDNTNAPQLTNTWGCLIDVLDACLVTGFGSQLVSNIIILDGVGTATFGSNHNFKQFQVIEFSGSTIPELNKEFKILGITSNKIEFVVNLPDQTITGTISAKLASLGWTKAFTGTQKAVYQAKDKIANPYFLRVDNSRDPVYTTTYAKFAKVGVLESCSGIDDLSGNQAPYLASSPTKNWIGTGSGNSAISGWFKWYYSALNNVSPSTYSEAHTPDEGLRSWVLVGNEKSFYFMPSFLPTSKADYLKNTYGFAVSKKDQRIKQTILAASIKDTSASSTIYYSSALTNLASLSFAGIRNIKSELVNTKFVGHFGAFGSSSGNNETLTLDISDGLLISQVFLKDQSGYFSGELDIIQFIFYDISSQPAISTYSQDDQAYLICQTVFQPENNYGFKRGGWCFNLGELL